MNVKRFFLAVLASFIYIGFFSWVYHGQLLMDTYKATAELWRPMSEEFSQYCAVMMISQFLTAFMLAFIFTRNYEGGGIGEGVRYGAYMGALLAFVQMGSYGWLPVDFPLVAAWMLGSLLTGLGSGIVIAMVYKK